MTPRCLLFLAALALAVSLTGCPRDDNTTDGCTGLVAGDLVITEYMNNPDGTDSGKEFFEIYNATSKAVSLRGVTIYLAKVDGSSPKTHQVTTGEVPSKGYFVFGDAPEASKPSYVDYSYGENLGGSGMANSSGLIGVKCGAVVVDEVTYTTAGTSGHSSELDGKMVPDSAANDLADNWCDAETPLTGNDFGTPGEPNDACASSANCIDSDGNSRTVVSPAAGELVISEFMANPAAISDDTGEWIELYALADVDLNGLTIAAGSSKNTIASNDCLHVAAGSYALLAKTADPTQNGNLPAPIALFTFTLPNSGSSTSPATIAVKKGDTVVDQVWYYDTTEGKSLQFDELALMADCSANPDNCVAPATANDNPLAFCDAASTWGSSTQYGTPGAANAECPNSPDITRCLENGVERDVVSPAVGDLVVTELMPKPNGSAALQSWFEVYAAKDVDLNGVQISNGSTALIIAPRDCLKVSAGSYLVFARSELATENGGLPKVDATFNFTLPTGGGTLTLSRSTDATVFTVLDSVSYLPPEASGSSISLDSGKLDSVSNDDPSAFCSGTLAYGTAGNLGTPGSANPACPAVVDPSQCTENGVQRASVPPTVGSLVITEIMASPSGNDDVQEWFEVYVKADADLNGLVLANGTATTASKTTLTSESCLHVTSGSYLVFGRATDPTVNGWIYDMTGIFGFSLPTSGSVVLKHGVDTIDYALYANAPSGKALQLDGANLDAAGNDDPAQFCAATATYGATSNLGTPGTANGVCGPVIDPDHCTDAGQTTARAVVTPSVGSLVLSEVMSAPTGTQSAKEWLEIYFKDDVDLNGVELVVGSSGTARYKVLSSTCIRPGAGGYAVLARSADAAVNGGLTNVAFTFDSDLPATGTTPLSLVRNSQLIDVVTYPATSGSGYSEQLASTKLDATLNDQTSNWCLADAAATYGTGSDHGTPGAVNGACLCAGISCDAEAPCNSSTGACECTDATCAAVGKACDATSKQCVTVDPNQCTDASSGAKRAMVIPAVGDLVISEYLADPSTAAAADATGEWVEVYVKTDVDLNGVKLGVGSSKYDLAAGSTCVRPGVGHYVVLARSADASVNGGLTSVLATFGTGLTNSGGQTLSLTRDAVTIDTVTTLSATTGASEQLSGAKLDATLNDTAANWCATASGTTFGKGDRGTPGAANGTCP